MRTRHATDIPNDRVLDNVCSSCYRRYLRYRVRQGNLTFLSWHLMVSKLVYWSQFLFLLLILYVVMHKSVCHFMCITAGSFCHENYAVQMLPIPSYASLQPLLEVVHWAPYHVGGTAAISCSIATFSSRTVRAFLSAAILHGLLGHRTWVCAVVSFGVTSKRKYSSVDHLDGIIFKIKWAGSYTHEMAYK
jgi:hypothetical protein